MSTVDKMLIKGIRSFDPENKLVISFFKPLTLIVGPNGAGKTVILTWNSSDVFSSSSENTMWTHLLLIFLFLLDRRSLSA